MTKLITITAVSIIALIGVAATSEAEGAQARCGMTIRGEVKLMQDLTCRETRPIRLIGPKAHLDLNGFYLSCGYGTTENPILMLEQGALLRNGNLSECTVKLLDRGGHKVRNVGVFTFDHRALIIASDSNEVVYSGLSADDHAVHIASGNYNLLSDNSMSADAIALSVAGDRNVIVHNHFSIVADGGPALGISGNLNRVYGNSTLEGCISVNPNSIGNIVEGNYEDPDFCPETPIE